jgi:hypothetical protein
MSVPVCGTSNGAPDRVRTDMATNCHAGASRVCLPFPAPGHFDKGAECRDGDARQDLSRPCFVRADQRDPKTLLMARFLCV